MDNKFINQGNVQLILNNIEKVIVGKEETAKLVMTAMLAGGHVLLEDVPGTAKTMMARSFAKSVKADFSRIQFTPDLLPSDITGINYYNQKEGEFVFRKGPLFANIILADEINRATPRTQSALLESMEEHQVTVDGTTYELNAPFTVIATQNPIETAGTYHLPEAQLDRFLLKLSMGYPDKDEEVKIIDRFLMDSPAEKLEAVCDAKTVTDMMKEVREVYVHDAIKKYIVDIVDKTREAVNISIGVSPRGTLNMVNAARAYAYVQGRSFVTPEDVARLVVPVFAHRIVLKSGMARYENQVSMLKDIMETVEVPTEDWDK